MLLHQERPLLSPKPLALSPFVELTKPRITVMVMATAGLSYWMAGGAPGLRLAVLLAAVGFASAAAGVLNQFLERDSDALMARTRKRPLPGGRVRPEAALQFGAGLAVLGLGL